MIKRQPIFYDLTEEQKRWLETKCCPICGLQKSKWNRRTDWRCCSKECTEKFFNLTYVWQYFKEKAFKRDKYSCVECGTKPMQRTYEGNFIPDTSKLIGDHIIPIAIGGKEYDLNNVQTLCINCNKIKTKEDMKKIAKVRRKEKTLSMYNTLEQTQRQCV